MTAFALAMACTPGPNNIMLTASGVNFGFARSVPHMSGVVVGFAVLLGAACAGLGLLLAAYPAIHVALKVAGAAYMLWLAWKIANAGQPRSAEGEGGRPLTFLQAAAFQWVNPKGVLASVGGVALFLRPESAALDTAIILVVFTLATVISVVIWTGFGTVVSGLLRDPRHARVFNAVMALLLVASIVPMVL
ncbi:MAG: LysE family translocator [Alphaproteobacteria bacterium]|nr:LysE family translocator [Alphaproteobacteria bacterium]